MDVNATHEQHPTPDMCHTRWSKTYEQHATANSLVYTDVTYRMVQKTVRLLIALKSLIGLYDFWL